MNIKIFNKTFFCLTAVLGLAIQASAYAWETEGLQIKGKLQSRWELAGDTKTGKWADSISIPHARIDALWEPFDWAELNLELEFADGVEAKDIYAKIKIDPLFKVTTGQFKKPFSQLQLTSPWDLLIPQRGLLDEYAVDKTKYGGFGGRDIGLMFSGTYKNDIKMEYSLGLFNNLPDKSEYHRDIVGRFEIQPFAGFGMGLNSSFKFFNDSGNTKNAYLIGGDLKYKLDNFKIQLEGAYGDNIEKNDKLAGAHCITSYEIPLNESLNLIPALMVEYFDPAGQIADDQALRLAGAMNLDINEVIRLVFSVDGVLQYTGDNMLKDPTRTILQLNVKF